MSAPRSARPSNLDTRAGADRYKVNKPPSSSGPGRRVLSPKTGVRLPVGVSRRPYRSQTREIRPSSFPVTTPDEPWRALMESELPRGGWRPERNPPPWAGRSDPRPRVRNCRSKRERDGGVFLNQFRLRARAQVDEQFRPPREVGPLDGPQDAGVCVALAVESLRQDVDAAGRSDVASPPAYVLAVGSDPRGVTGAIREILQTCSVSA